jgi:hypothetical protein
MAKDMCSDSLKMPGLDLMKMSPSQGHSLKAFQYPALIAFYSLPGCFNLDLLPIPGHYKGLDRLFAEILQVSDLSLSLQQPSAPSMSEIGNKGGEGFQH